MRTYKVQSGDTFGNIARKTGISILDLKKLNPQIKDINCIVAGQSISLPNTEISSQSKPDEIQYFNITEKNLCAIIPKFTLEKANQFVGVLNLAMKEFSINTPIRQSMFLSQIAHETGGFRWLCELGKDEYFKKYENRKDLGNTIVGDGAKFKGRGFIQITGRDNYSKAGIALNLDLVNSPEIAETPTVAA